MSKIGKGVEAAEAIGFAIGVLTGLLVTSDAEDDIRSTVQIAIDKLKAINLTELAFMPERQSGD